ncbi:hypothetical protein BGX28_002468 [Mortierella sp. GBA30]|nr:hypothetical protein BGX28_002468 [Mortierella sp. GBA30]
MHTPRSAPPARMIIAAISTVLVILVTTMASTVLQTTGLQGIVVSPSSLDASVSTSHLTMDPAADHRAFSNSSQRAMEDADVVSPLGSSVNSNDAFDGDIMDLHRRTSDTQDSDASMADAEINEAHTSATAAAEGTRSVHGKVASDLASVTSSDVLLERKPRLRRKVERLQTKNQALKSSVHQARTDLAIEREQRQKIDQIYLKIKKELNQRLEAEEIKVLNLKSEMEQMASEMEDLKDQLVVAKANASMAASLPSSTTLGKGPSSSGYRIGYDSNAFALSSGFSNIGGLMPYPHTRSNMDLIDGQDDSEEFLFSHSYSASTVRSTSVSPMLPSTESRSNMSCSEDDDGEEDDRMDEEDVSDDDDQSSKSTLFKFMQPCRRTVGPPTVRRSSISSATSLPPLVEEEADESDPMPGSDGNGNNSVNEAETDNAPRTMMEIILERERSRTPEDEVADVPADANETFESMAQKLLSQAIHSRFTVAQAHLQLEDIVLKYGAQPEQMVDVIAKEVLRWWEAERLCLGGPVSGGWGTDTVVINQKTGERAGPRVVVERKIESFFGPLLLQFVASSLEQGLLLKKLAQYASADARWLRNHNAVLVALYKYDVLEAEAVLDWWQGLEESRDVLDNGGHSLRSLNARFAAWLEDEEDDSGSEDEDDDVEETDSEVESEYGSDDEEDGSDEEEGHGSDEEEEDDEVPAVESMLGMAYPTVTVLNNGRAEDSDIICGSSPLQSSCSSADKTIRFCANNMYYSQDGTVTEQCASSASKDKESKKYVQCPPLKTSDDEEHEIGAEDEEHDAVQKDTIGGKQG